MSFARAKGRPRYRSPKEDHHVVAKAAKNARFACSVLDNVNIGYNSKYYIIRIKTGLHRRLHTNLYDGFANSVVISAYNHEKSYSQRRNNVIRALDTLKGMIKTMEHTAPY